MVPPIADPVVAPDHGPVEGNWFGEVVLGAWAPPDPAALVVGGAVVAGAVVAGAVVAGAVVAGAVVVGAAVVVVTSVVVVGGGATVRSTWLCAPIASHDTVMLFAVFVTVTLVIHADSVLLPGVEGGTE